MLGWLLTITAKMGGTIKSDLCTTTQVRTRGTIPVGSAYGRGTSPPAPSIESQPLQHG